MAAAARSAGCHPPTGLLVRDLNHDGVINTGRELFGTATLVNGQLARNGFEALAALDSNHDGQISKQDANFAELKVWVDRNQDGQSEAGELVSLEQLGITSLNLASHTGTELENGNLLGLISSYTTQDGKVHELVDVWFGRGQHIRHRQHGRPSDGAARAPACAGPQRSPLRPQRCIWRSRITTMAWRRTWHAHWMMSATTPLI